MLWKKHHQPKLIGVKAMLCGVAKVLKVQHFLVVYNGEGQVLISGVFLGTNEYRKQNWEGLLEKVRARLSHWKWLLPQLSYRGRVLICNNLVASSLWHRMMILEPPEDLVRQIQRCLVDFFPALAKGTSAVSAQTGRRTRPSGYHI